MEGRRKRLPKHTRSSHLVDNLAIPQLRIRFALECLDHMEADIRLPRVATNRIDTGKVAVRM